MDRLINAITAVNSDVIGTRYESNVATNVLAETCIHGLRLFHQARLLFARLLGRTRAGLMTLSGCHVGPVVSGSLWMPEPVRVRVAHARLYRRSGKPGPARLRSRF
jgi:hypothetical protein